MTLDHSILSPSGHVSKRARKAAMRRAELDIFGGQTCDQFMADREAEYVASLQISKRDALLQQATRLRELANRGMSTRKFNREAMRLEALAAQL